MKKLLIFTGALVFLVLTVTGGTYLWDANFAWSDVRDFYDVTDPAPFIEEGQPEGSAPQKNGRARLGLTAVDIIAPQTTSSVRFLGKTRYLNNARAVVTHTLDDSTEHVLPSLEALDRYGIKGTFFISTEKEAARELWRRLRQAVVDGHEVGSHSRLHQCQWPDSFLFCFRAYSDYEVSGSRDDILAYTDQPHVWSWAYPCGLCERFDFVPRKLARAGYLAARTYPGEPENLHNVPDLQTYADDPYRAAYTQVVQKKGGIALTGRTDVDEINLKFEEVYHRGGIYHFLSHPAWLDFGPDDFYERHLAFLGGRSDVWYVPMGPLYAYQRLVEVTRIEALRPSGNVRARFAVYNNLDPKIFSGSITLEFTAPGGVQVFSRGEPILLNHGELINRWDAEYYRRSSNSLLVTLRPNTILEFR